MQTKRTIYNAFTYYVAVIFFLILFFGYTLSYFNSPDISGDFVLSIIENIYTIKKVLLFVSFICVFLRKKFSIISILTVLIVVAIVLFTYEISPEQIKLFTDVYLDFFCGITIFLLLVGGLVRFEKFIPVAMVVGRLFLCLCLLSVFTHSDWEYFALNNYMFISNGFLAPVAITIYAIFKKNHWFDYVLVLFGITVVLLYGSRGDFFVLTLFAIIMLFSKINKRNVWKLLLLMTLFAIGVIFIIILGVFENVESRTIEKLFSGEFFESTERIEIWVYLITKSFSDGFLGKGLCADRFYLLELKQSVNEVYAHNFFIEVIVDFGLIGAVAAISVVIILVNFLIKCHDKEEKKLIIMLACISFIPLMFSRSFLSEPIFFIMLGVILNWQITYKGKKVNQKYEKSFHNYSYI